MTLAAYLNVKQSCGYLKLVVEAQLNARYVKITTIQISLKQNTESIYYNR
jgi:hypothetical protein